MLDYLQNILYNITGVYMKGPYNSRMAVQYRGEGKQWEKYMLVKPNLQIALCVDLNVPARNLVFLSLAASWAETLKARHIFIGVNSVDYSNYPDCRKEFIESFLNTVNLGTCAADEDWKWSIETPLQDLSKAEIVRWGTQLGVDYSLTVTCYTPDSDGRACGKCASCRLRRDGFIAAGLDDPTRYY